MSFTRTLQRPRQRMKWARLNNLGAVSAFIAGVHAGNGLAHGVLPPTHSRTRA